MLVKFYFAFCYPFQTWHLPVWIINCQIYLLVCSVSAKKLSIAGWSTQLFILTGINTSKVVAQDDEPDLGKTLSPLGSTSSLQDLMETNSSRQPVPEPVKTTWLERERQKKSVVVIEPTIAGCTNLESKSGMYFWLIKLNLGLENHFISEWATLK